REASREGKDEGRRSPRPPWLDSGGSAEPPGARETHAAWPISGSRLSLLWKLFVFILPPPASSAAPTPRRLPEAVFSLPGSVLPLPFTFLISVLFRLGDKKSGPPREGTGRGNCRSAGESVLRRAPLGGVTGLEAVEERHRVDFGGRHEAPLEQGARVAAGVVVGRQGPGAGERLAVEEGERHVGREGADEVVRRAGRLDRHAG